MIIVAIFLFYYFLKNRNTKNDSIPTHMNRPFRRRNHRK